MAQVFFIPVLLLYFCGLDLEYWMVSRAAPMSNFLVWSSLVNHPPSSVKPMESIWERDSTSLGSASEGEERTLKLGCLNWYEVDWNWLLGIGPMTMHCTLRKVWVESCLTQDQWDPRRRLCWSRYLAGLEDLSRPAPTWGTAALLWRGPPL